MTIATTSRSCRKRRSCSASLTRCRGGWSRRPSPGSKPSKRKYKTASSSRTSGLRLRRSSIGKRRRTDMRRGSERSAIASSGTLRSKEVAYSFRRPRRGPTISRWLTWRRGTKLRLRIDLIWRWSARIEPKRRSRCSGSSFWRQIGRRTTTTAELVSLMMSRLKWRGSGTSRVTMAI